MAIDAMYVEIGSHGDYMFVNVDTETPFTAEFPRDKVIFGRMGRSFHGNKFLQGCIPDLWRRRYDHVPSGPVSGSDKMVRIKYGSP